MPRVKGRVFYGWWIVLASALMNVYAGGTFFYGFGAFFTPIRATFGWTYAATSLAFLLQRLEGGIMGPIAGFLVDRAGPRKLMFVGFSIAGAGFLLLGRVDSLIDFYVSFLVVATGFSLSTYSVTMTAIANWFVKRRSRAMSFVAAGYGASGLLVPVLVMLIDQSGWRSSLALVGIGVWVLCLPLSLLIRHKPLPYGYLPDGYPKGEPTEELAGHSAPSPEKGAWEGKEGYTVREALRTRAFWLICLASLVQQFATSAIFVHIVPYLESVGIPRVTAALAVTGMTLFSLIGRLGFGFLGDTFNKRYLMALAFCLQFVGAVVFAYIDSAWMIVPFLLIYGPGYGGPIPLRPALQGDFFGRSNFGSIMGMMNAVTMIGGLVSPVFAGWVYDVMGSYRPAFQTVAFLAIPSVPVILLAKPPRRTSDSASDPAQPW